MMTTPNSRLQRQAYAQKKKAASSGHLHEQAFNNSLQANIIFIVKDGKIIRANRAACKLLGYTQKELLTKKRADIFNISDQTFKKMLRLRKITGSARADLSIIRKNGVLRPCEITSVIFKDANGIDNSIMSIADLRERMLKQKKIDMVNEEKVADHIATALSISDSRQVESDDWIKSVARTSYDVIWDWDINADQLAFGNNYEKVFGHKLPGNKPSFKEWVNSFMPKEKSSMEKRIRKVLISDEMSWEDTYQFVLSNGTKSQVISRANIIRDDEGKATRMIGVIHDISKLRQLEGILEEEIRIKEKQIIEAIVEAKEMERSDIGKELHDNINQLLTASILYLSMARKNIKKGDIYLTHSSEYIHTAIDEIRKLTKGLTSGPAEDFGLCLAIESMSRDAMETSPLKIHCILDYALELTMSEKFKLNTFRIFQEQLNNTLKHAKATNVHISFSQTPAGYVLSIADDGEGFDVHKKTTGIGIGNIISRAELYKGNAHFLSEPGKGCTLVVTFPVIYAV